MDYSDPATTDPDNPPLSDCAPDNDLSAVTNVQQGSGNNGYWMLGADGHVYPFGGAVGFPGRVRDAVAMAPRHDGKGYWIVDRAGPRLQLRVGQVLTVGARRFPGRVRQHDLGHAERQRLLALHQPGPGVPVRRRVLVRRHVAANR